MSKGRRGQKQLRFTAAALAVGVGGFALACTHPAAAQRADQPAASVGGGLDEIVVASPPNKPASVELVNGPQSALSGVPTNGGAAAADPNAPARGLEGFIEGGFGSYGSKEFGGGVTIPLVKGRLQLRVEGSQSHLGVR